MGVHYVSVCTRAGIVTSAGENVRKLTGAQLSMSQHILQQMQGDENRIHMKGERKQG